MCHYILIYTLDFSIYLYMSYIYIYIYRNSVIITASVLAIKYNEDDYYANTFYAKVGGVSLDEINQLEYDFLQMCDFSMGIKPKKFQKYQEYLNQYIE